MMAAVDIVFVLGTFLISYLLIHIYRRQSRNESDSKGIVPGPPGLPIIGNIIDIVRYGYKGDVLMTKWAQKYGRIFQFKMGSKTVYVLNDYEFITEAMEHPGIQGRPKLQVITSLLGPGSGIVHSSGRTWMNHRRFFFRCFRKFGRGDRSLEDRVSDEAARITLNILKHCGLPIDVSYTFSLASCNIISSLVSGRQLDHSDPRLVKEVVALLQIVNSVGPAALNNNIPQFAYFESGKRFIKANLTMKEIFDDLIKQHLLRAKEDAQIPSKDIIDEYINKLQLGEEPDGSFTKSSLIWLIRDLYIAGTETVATTLRWSILLLMTHPRVQARCQAELTSSVGRERFATTADSANLPYINATLLEISRVGNVAPLGIPHKATEDVELGGYHIPKESVIVTNIHAVMNDSKLWIEPEKFNPERFLDKDGTFIKAKQIIPFGAGKRICAGMQLAKVELFVWLTRLLHQFNILPPEDGSDIPNINEGVVAITRTPLPFRVRFVKRDD